MVETRCPRRGGRTGDHELLGNRLERRVLPRRPNVPVESVGGRTSSPPQTGGRGRLPGWSADRRYNFAMHVPSYFVEDRVDVLHEAIRGAGLATLVTVGADGLNASHIPLILEPGFGPLGRLVGHLARANSQWEVTPEGSSALAIVLGPDAYVTPTWYPSKRETGRVVPTWDYVAIHAQGTVRFFHEHERLLDIINRLTERYEGTRQPRWKVADAPPDYVDALLKGIVGVELTITRLQGQWKVSQNKTESDRRGVEEGLRSEGQSAMASLVRDPRG